MNRFLATGFLPPPFREQMQLTWTGRDQELFDFLIQLAAAANRLLPAPVSRFPFNTSLHELRLQMIRNRLVSLGRTVTPRSVRFDCDCGLLCHPGQGCLYTTPNLAPRPVWFAHLSCVSLGPSERPGGALGPPAGGGRPGGTKGRSHPARWNIGPVLLPVSIGPVELWAGPALPAIPLVKDIPTMASRFRVSTESSTRSHILSAPPGDGHGRPLFPLRSCDPVEADLALCDFMTADRGNSLTRRAQEIISSMI